MSDLCQTLHGAGRYIEVVSYINIYIYISTRTFISGSPGWQPQPTTERDLQTGHPERRYMECLGIENDGSCRQASIHRPHSAHVLGLSETRGALPSTPPHHAPRLGRPGRAQNTEQLAAHGIQVQLAVVDMGGQKLYEEFTEGASDLGPN